LFFIFYVYEMHNSNVTERWHLTNKNTNYANVRKNLRKKYDKLGEILRISSFGAPRKYTKK